MRLYPISLKLHRFSAVLLLAFVSVHLINHLAAIFGVEVHKAFMETLRLVYRAPLLEVLLILAVAVQCVTGFIQLRQTWGRWPSVWHKVQIFSGAYLLFFMINHTVAILFTLRIWLGVDSDFYAAAGGLLIDPLHWFFVPYYLLGVAAFFAHIASFLYFKVRMIRDSRNGISYAVMGGGIVVSVLIVLTFSGAFYEIELPETIRSSYEQMIGKRT